jgi:hypothetical protein
MMALPKIWATMWPDRRVSERAEPQVENRHYDRLE